VIDVTALKPRLESLDEACGAAAKSLTGGRLDHGLPVARQCGEFSPGSAVGAVPPGANYAFTY
jgi:hypothetical protein